VFKSSVRFNRNKLQYELNMMHLGDEDDEFFSNDRFDRTENFEIFLAECKYLYLIFLPY
jgi:hypothetical protein